MLNKIRNELMADDGGSLSGDVEVDETYVGGHWKGRRGRPGEGDPKSPVLGMVERGGRVIATTVSNVSRTVVMPHIEERVLPSTTIFTDEWQVYNPLAERGWTHRRIRHREKIYVMG